MRNEGQQLIGKHRMLLCFTNTKHVHIIYSVDRSTLTSVLASGVQLELESKVKFDVIDGDSSFERKVQQLETENGVCTAV